MLINWWKCHKTTSQQRSKNTKWKMSWVCLPQISRLWPCEVVIWGCFRKISAVFALIYFFSEILVTLRQQYFPFEQKNSEKSTNWNLLKLYKILCCIFNDTQCSMTPGRGITALSTGVSCTRAPTPEGAPDLYNLWCKMLIFRFCQNACKSQYTWASGAPAILYL